MHSPVTFSSPGPVPTSLHLLTCRLFSPEIYVVGLSFLGSYTSCERHTERTIEAI